MQAVILKSNAMKNLKAMYSAPKHHWGSFACGSE
jgi:hypothetical protein